RILVPTLTRVLSTSLPSQTRAGPVRRKRSSFLLLMALHAATLVSALPSMTLEALSWLANLAKVTSHSSMVQAMFSSDHRLRRDLEHFRRLPNSLTLTPYSTIHRIAQFAPITSGRLLPSAVTVIPQWSVRLPSSRPARPMYTTSLQTDGWTR